MDDLTAQERHLIMTLRHLMSFTVIVHRNERWRIVLADQETGRTETGEGEDFGRAWDDLGGKDKSVAEVDPLSWSPSGFQRRLFRCPRRVRPIHLSFVARWAIWFALDVIRPSLPASRSRQRSPSATGLRKPTGKRAAGRRRVAG